MEVRGASRGREGREARRAALLASSFALATSLALWGFTVDDALITCRYAHHVATGRGYTFNPGGPVTDGVTPLGLPYLLAPFARGGALQALVAAKLMGAAAHALAAGLVAWAVSTLAGPRLRWAGVGLWLVAAPAVAWSASGLETPLAELLVAAGAALRLVGRREPLGVVLLGLSAWVRPELLPLAVTLGAPRAAGASEPVVGARTFGRIALVCAPFTVAAAVRVALFGRPAPLSALAKPADVTLGLQYSFVCLLVVGAVGLLAPLALRGADRMTRWLSAAFFVHAGAVAFAGGDWMPVSRLFVPALPVLALAVAGLARASTPRATALRAALALAGEIWVWVVVGHKLARVQADRDALIAEARPLLASSRVIASLDVGWLGAAAPDAAIVDLAGVTDPEIASLPGGHLRKKTPDGLLKDRGVDTIVMQLFKDYPVAEPWSETVFARGLEIYVATEPGLEGRFEPAGVLEGRARYVILRRR
ncbi:MAG: hypothetical protein IPM79_21510 [Polyangiaceae bacterium]|nr:hypothetical protein [Polyangiaceae bacterium]